MINLVYNIFAFIKGQTFEAAESVCAVVEVTALAGGTIGVGRNHRHGHRHTKQHVTVTVTVILNNMSVESWNIPSLGENIKPRICWKVKPFFLDLSDFQMVQRAKRRKSVICILL